MSQSEKNRQKFFPVPKFGLTIRNWILEQRGIYTKMFNEIDSSMTIGEQPGSLDRSKRLFFCIEALPKITPLRNHLILDSDYVAEQHWSSSGWVLLGKKVLLIFCCLIESFSAMVRKAKWKKWRKVMSSCWLWRIQAWTGRGGLTRNRVVTALWVNEVINEKGKGERKKK